MKINVLGLGNTMFGDEGFGVEAVKLHESTHDYIVEVNFIDGGTQGIYLLDIIESPDALLVYDALIPVDYEVKVHYYNGNDMPAFIHRKMSSHQIGLSELLSLAKLHGKLPKKMALVGIPPQELGMGVGLSDTAAKLLPEAVEHGHSIIHDWLMTK